MLADVRYNFILWSNLYAEGNRLVDWIKLFYSCGRIVINCEKPYPWNTSEEATDWGFYSAGIKSNTHPVQRKWCQKIFTSLIKIYWSYSTHYLYMTLLWISLILDRFMGMLQNILHEWVLSTNVQFFIETNLSNFIFKKS